MKETQYHSGAFTVTSALEVTASLESVGRAVSATIGEKIGVTPPLTIVTDPSPWVRIAPVSSCRKSSPVAAAPDHEQGYCLDISPEEVTIVATDAAGLYYGYRTLEQILGGSGRSAGAPLQSVRIVDYPAMPHRGLMLDCSRGRVYTLEYLKSLVVLLSRMKMNVLQLYIEHTFAFPSLPEIWEGADPVTPDDIQVLDQWCQQHHVELQPNLQSFGHCNRILTTRGFRELRESDLYWTLSPAAEGTYTLLETMYDDFLPCFSSNRFNVGSDETYDLGTGQSASRAADEGKGRLYLSHLLRLHELAKERGKRVMIFGDVILKYPDLIADIPTDITFLDWMYDPKDHYGTPSVFRKHRKPFWVCPGTGAWNTLFPRQEGAVQNILTFTLEGLREGAEGMLLTDWGDHGSYGMPAATHYSYGIAAAAAWNGAGTTRESAEHGLPGILGENETYLSLHRILEKIHRLPALWSKNRSQCTMAFFDEPLTGLSVTGPVPPADLEPLKPLPSTIDPVMDQEGHHPMRPFFRLTEEAVSGIEVIITEADGTLREMDESPRYEQYQYILETYRLLAQKNRLSRSIRDQFTSCEITIDAILDFERDLRLMIRDYVALQMDYVRIWHSFARTSEIAVSMTWYAHIIERLDYLKEWLRGQRQKMEAGIQPDYSLSSYETAGYRTVPTY